MADRNKIKELLGSGLDNHVVAAAVGVTPAYITQLMSEPEFASVVIELRTKNLTAANERDKKIDSIEDKLIEKLSDTVDYLVKPRDILHSFAVLNNARRRGIPAQASANLQQTVINLVLPRPVIRHFTTTPQGEVIDMKVNEERQTLVTMPSGELLRSLSAKDTVNGDKYEKLSRFLPSQNSGPKASG